VRHGELFKNINREESLGSKVGSIIAEEKDRENNVRFFYVELPVNGKLVALTFKEKVIALCKTAT
jgi:hypothetical protein